LPVAQFKPGNRRGHVSSHEACYTEHSLDQEASAVTAATLACCVSSSNISSSSVQQEAAANKATKLYKNTWVGPHGVAGTTICCEAAFFSRAG